MPDNNTNQDKINQSFKDYDQAQTFRSQGNYPKAVEYYQRVIENNPCFQAPYTILQYTPIETAQLNSLIHTYRQALQEQPNLPFAWSSLGDALTQQGGLEAAQDCYKIGGYHQVIQTRPHLADLNWPPEKRTGPDFIIIGASRCGTTSLYNYLSTHPQALLPTRKELDFFSSQAFRHGKEWYLSHFPALADQPGFITGEATTSYFDLVQVPQELHRHFPQTKLILILRNPIERAISWHYHKARVGAVNCDIEESIYAEMDALKNAKTFELINLGYQAPNNLLGGLYVYKIMRWLAFFSSDQILILKSEDLYEKPWEIMQQVFCFLGIPDYESVEYVPHNNLDYPPISSSLREKMRQFFDLHNQKLEQYLCREFNWQ